MSSCCDKTSHNSSKPEPENAHESTSKRWPQLQNHSLAPFISALLHGSCCWLPALLDVLTVGSASVSAVHRLQPVFLAITLVLLGDRFRRRGLTRDNMLHLVFTCVLLGLPRVLEALKKPQPVAGHGGRCH
ncbi:hypothetical protein VB005_04851 [Metarhizium brunneum]